MLKLKTAFISIFIFLQAQSSAAEMIPGSEFFTPTWGGAAYIDVNTGRFSHCSIGTLYANNDSLTIAEYADGNIQIGVQSISLSNFSISQTFATTTHIDARNYPQRVGQMLFENFLVVGPYSKGEIFSAIKRGNVLSISAPRWQRNFSLYGTNNALEANQQCVQSNFNYLKSNSSTSSGTMTPLVDKTLAYQLATSIITSSGLSDFQYLTQSELDERNWGSAVAWNAASGDVTGVILTATLQGENLRDSDDDDILFLIKECSGDHATLTRQIGVIDAFEVREIIMKCVIDSENSYVNYLTKTLFGNIIIYQVMIVRNSFDRERWDNDAFRDGITAASANLLVKFNQ